MLEMNTNPGFSSNSSLPRQIIHKGMTIKEYCSLEIEKAYNRQNFVENISYQKVMTEAEPKAEVEV